MYIVYHKNNHIMVNDYRKAWETYRFFARIASTSQDYVSLVDASTGEVIQDNSSY